MKFWPPVNLELSGSVARLLRLFFSGVCCLLGGATGLLSQTSGQPPNIVLILTDDQGWNGTSVLMDPDVPGSRSDFYQTPRLEELATSGMRFTNGYSSAAVCAPTRAAIQTGMSPAQLQMTDLPHATPGSLRWEQRYERLALTGPAPQPLDPELLTLPKMIQQANSGYVTAHFSKWHLDVPTGVSPTLAGYDLEDDMFPLPADEVDPWGVFAMANTANTFMQQRVNNNEPFFMQLSHRAVHDPVRSRQVIRDKYESLPAGMVHDDPGYAAMTEDLDTSVGMVLDRISELGIEDNTYVIFVSDNGAASSLSSNAPLARGKSTLGEGGIRIPYIVRGPNVAPGSISDVPVTTTDLYSTVADLVEHVGPLPESVEGASLVPLLQNAGQLPAGTDHLERRYHKNGELYWHKPVYSGILDKPESAVRDGDFKLVVQYGTYGQPDQVFLYNLATDISETANLASSMPQKVVELQTKLEGYLEAIDASLAFEVEADVMMEWNASRPGKDADGWRSTSDLNYMGRETWKLDEDLRRPDRVRVEAFQPELPDRAFKFDGGDRMHRQFFQVGDDARRRDTFAPNSADFDRSATMEFWIKLDSLNHSQVLFESGDDTGGISATIGDADSDGKSNDLRLRVLGLVGADNGAPGTLKDLTVTAKLDRFADPSQDFVHVVAVFNDDQNDRYGEIYVNGALAARVDGTLGVNQSLQWDGFDEASLGHASGNDLGGNGGPGELPFAGGFQGEMALMRFYNQAISAVTIAENYNSVLAPVDFNLESLAGDVEAPLERPTNVSLGAFESPNLMVIHERADIVADTQPLDALISGTSLLNHPEDAVPGQLPAGTKFSSFLLQFDPLGSDDSSTASAAGSIDFDGEILGLLIDSESLDVSDEIVGSIGDYGGVADRGLTLGENGLLAVSSDRQTLIFGLTTPGDEMIQFRVLTEFVPEADFDASGAVDIVDLSLWESAYGLTEGGDADSDGDSDGFDFLRWQQQSAASLVADFDGDGQVDGADLVVWESAFGVDDGADVGGDGDSDGFDFLRWQLEAAAAAFVSADFNGDQQIDGADLGVWESAFGVDASADADGDGDSDGRDFLVWQRSIGLLPLTGAAITVPEPSCVWLSVLVGLLPGSRCRRV